MAIYISTEHRWLHTLCLSSMKYNVRVSPTLSHNRVKVPFAVVPETRLFANKNVVDQIKAYRNNTGFVRRMFQVPKP